MLDLSSFTPVAAAAGGECRGFHACPATRGLVEVRGGSVWIRNHKPDCTGGGSNRAPAAVKEEAEETSSLPPRIIATGVRCGPALLHGRHYLEVTFPSPLTEASVMLGVSTPAQDLTATDVRNINLLGSTRASWGLSHKGSLHHAGRCPRRSYMAPCFRPGATLGCLLDLYNHTLTYYRDGHCLGVAFHLPRSALAGVPLYFAVSASGDSVEVTLTRALRQYGRLREVAAARVLSAMQRRRPDHHDHDDDERDVPVPTTDTLPLPKTLKKYLLEL